MASIQRDIDVDVPLRDAWDALRDVGRIHQRLVPGFVADCRMEGRVRVVTFGNGSVLREPILDIDDARHRVAWAAVGGPFEHYNASVQAFDLGGDRTRIRWIADLLPDEAASTVDGRIAEGLSVMKRTLEGTGES
ncbi:SRPBCC family protein [Lysobacter arvi]|uniref:SRPBCC family protein n=1 Tax=Lysobacter arvi TaxID=3038776 RepID=A0ABU1CG80_9GAMM|nr:SRPBCC family protein [Lysobacter arvi]MDR0183956.1 SRPBCC family protein [Lysobacter arvi]